MSRYSALALLLLPIIAILAGFGLIGLAPDENSSTGYASAPPLSPEPAASPQAGPPSALVGRPVTLPERSPESLRGTEPPSGWEVLDASGNLVATPALRALFEYYLAALGEETLAQLVGRIEDALAGLPEPARSQARETLARYLDYKLAVSELEAQAGHSGVTDDPESWLQQLRDLRRSHLGGATAEAFFAADEAVDRFQLERRRIMADPELDPDRRAQLLARAEAALPEPLRQARRQADRFNDYRRASEQLANDPAALQAYREAEFGAEAAAALAQLEREQAEWNQRWQAYSQAAAQLDNAGLAEVDRQAARERLRNEHFQGAERLRAEALDSLR